MRNIILSLVFALATWGMSAQSLKVCTYNVRVDVPDDSINGDVWLKRCQVMCDQLNYEAPEIIGTQEIIMASQLQGLLDRLDGYDYIGARGYNGRKSDVSTAIFYRKGSVKLLDQGCFWLSETPDVPGKGWDAAYVRVCVWGRFQDIKTQGKFIVFNLHLDNKGEMARINSAHLMLKRIPEIAQGLPVVLTGDFNASQDEEVYRAFAQSGILKDTYTCARLRFAENGTYNDFRSNLKSDNRIDHIFVSHDFDIEAYAVRTDSYWTATTSPGNRDRVSFVRRNPSDHYPVFVKLKFKN